MIREKSPYNDYFVSIIVISVLFGTILTITTATTAGLVDSIKHDIRASIIPVMTTLVEAKTDKAPYCDEFFKEIFRKCDLFDTNCKGVLESYVNLCK